MPARIRLRRMGRKKKPHFRVVVTDGAAPRDGRFVETLGYYKPMSDPARLVLDLERVDHWLSEGASPSGTVKSLISKARRGGDAKVAIGEEDAEAREQKRAEALAARRAAEKAEADAKAAEEKAAAEAAAAEAAAAEAAAAAEEAEAEEGAEAEATATETEEAPAEEEAVDDEAPEAEAEEAPEAEADEAPEAEAEEEEEKSE